MIVDVEFVNFEKLVVVVSILRVGLTFLEESASVFLLSVMYYFGYVCDEKMFELKMYFNKFFVLFVEDV